MLAIFGFKGVWFVRKEVYAGGKMKPTKVRPLTPLVSGIRPVFAVTPLTVVTKSRVASTPTPVTGPKEVVTTVGGNADAGSCPVI